MGLFEDLNNLMVQYSFRPRRKLGQNFLIDEKIIGKLVEAADLKSEDKVLEIGSGTGFLTRALLEKKCQVFGVEVDETLQDLLENEIQENKENFTLIKGDFLKVKLPEFNKIVSTPPYTISSAILQKLFSLDFEKAVLLLQKDFVEKLLSQPGLPDYVAITVLTNYFFESRVIANVSPKAFFPAPKMLSAIIKLKSAKRFGQALDEALFTEFIKTVFRFKNKNLSNALHFAFPFLKEKTGLKEKQFKAFLTELELKDEKVYLLEPGQFVKVFNELIELKKK